MERRYIPLALIFASTARASYFISLADRAGLPIIRFHDLRHTAASLMLNHGVPVIAVSRRLGHSKPSITLDIYGHLIPSMQVEAAQKIDDLVTPVELGKIAPKLHRTAPDFQHPTDKP